MNKISNLINSRKSMQKNYTKKEKYASIEQQNCIVELYISFLQKNFYKKKEEERTNVKSALQL